MLSIGEVDMSREPVTLSQLLPSSGVRRILVSGDRDWKAFHIVWVILRDLKSLIIHGDYRGADTAAKQAATKLELEANSYPARWSLVGRKAGPMRNQRMLDKHPNINLALLFHDYIQNSSGTKDMQERLERSRIPWVLYDSHGRMLNTNIGEIIT
jgi:hypothetical protein